MANCLGGDLLLLMCKVWSSCEIGKGYFVSGQGTDRRRRRKRKRSMEKKTKKTNKNKRCFGLLARSPNKYKCISRLLCKSLLTQSGSEHLTKKKISHNCIIYFLNMKFEHFHSYIIKKIRVIWIRSSDSRQLQNKHTHQEHRTDDCSTIYKPNTQRRSHQTNDRHQIYSTDWK